MKIWVRLVVAIVVVSGAAMAESVATAVDAGPDPTVGAGGSGGAGALQPAGTTAAPGSDLAVTGPQFGIAYGDVLPWMTASSLSASLDDAVAVGATWVRLDFSWADVQPTGPDSYRWGGLDRVVSAAGARGLEVLPTLAYTPKWARPEGCGSDKCAPANDAAFAHFGRTAAARYAPRGVHAWEIWNEENTPGFWAPAPSAAGYVSLLDDTAAAIRSVDPGAFLISGGLTATLTLKGAVDTRTFLAEICALGANRVVDAIGYHPYTYPFLPTFTGSFATAWNKIEQTPVSMVSILAQYGTPDLPLWLTEYGAPSSTSVPAGGATTSQVTEARQAEIAGSAVTAVLGSHNIGALFWYTDGDLPGNRPIDHYGLRQTDGTAKPAMAALRQAIVNAESAESSATTGPSATSGPSVSRTATGARSASGRRSS